MTTVNGKSILPPPRKAEVPVEKHDLEEVMRQTGSSTCREARLKMNEGRHGRKRLVMNPIDPLSPRRSKEKERRLRQEAKRAASISST